MNVGVDSTDVPAILAGMALGGLVAGAAGWLIFARARSRRAEELSRLSHDLRTPLSSITAYAEILQDDDDPGLRQRFLTIIRDEAARMLSMLDSGSARTADPLPSGRSVVPRRPVEADARMVLVVDDDHFLREAVSTALTTRGYRAVAAGGGEEALSRARADRPDVILMDLLMPEMNGEEVLRRLRADPITRGIPVIITTGETGRRDPEGAAAVLIKPVSPETLIATVERIIPGGDR